MQTKTFSIRRSISAPVIFIALLVAVENSVISIGSTGASGVETSFTQTDIQGPSAKRSSLDQDLVLIGPDQPVRLSRSNADFEQNKGQFDPKISFVLRSRDTTTLLSSGRSIHVVGDPREMLTDSGKAKAATAVFITLANSNRSSAAQGVNKTRNRTNYFTGDDPSKWVTDVPTFEYVVEPEIVEGVDRIRYRTESGFQTAFYYDGSVDLSTLQFRIEGADSVIVQPNGDLVIKTKTGDVHERAPLLIRRDGNHASEPAGYSVSLDAKGTDESGRIFTAGVVKRNDDLSLLTRNDSSPDLGALGYSGLFGDAAVTYDLKTDGAGSVYATGVIGAFGGLPISPGYDDTPNGGFDAFVVKINGSGSEANYATYLGGSANDFGYGIDIDPSGNAYVTGETSAGTTPFPTTAGAFDVTHNGSSDAFVVKLSPTGTALLYSTFVGGAGADRGRSIRVGSGTAYVTGRANSGFPTAGTPFDATHNGGDDVFALALSPIGNLLTYSTFLGGGGNDEGLGIEADVGGNAYVTGSAGPGGAAFPTTAGAFDTTANGGFDVFVSKFDPAGSSLTYSTFVGGGGTDVGEGIAIDGSGSVFVAGRTDIAATPFPTTPGAFDSTYNGGFSDVFAFRLNSTGTGLIYSTFIGGDESDEGRDISVDGTGRALVTGDTFNGTVDFPTTVGAYDTSHNGEQDAFAVILSTAGCPEYSTFLGGSVSDRSETGSFGSGGSIAVGGTSISVDFPVTDGAFATNGRAFISRILPSLSPLPCGAGPTPTPSPTPTATPTPTPTPSPSPSASPTPLYTRGDYDGDNKTDLTVWRPVAFAPNLSAFYTVRSTDGSFFGIQFGNAGDVAIAGDFDGDNKTDFGVSRFTSADGVDLIYLESSTNTAQFPVWGNTGDVFISGDYDGDKKTDVMAWRPSDGTWYIVNSSGGFTFITHGQSGDKPYAMDTDGDGTSNLVYFRPSSGDWVVRNNDSSTTTTNFGLSTDIPVPADYDGDNKDDIAVFRDGLWIVLQSSNGQVEFMPFGAPGDVPVPGDYDGDNLYDRAVYRGGIWHMLRSSLGYTGSQFGAPTDTAMPKAYIP